MDQLDQLFSMDPTRPLKTFGGLRLDAPVGTVLHSRQNVRHITPTIRLIQERMEAVRQSFLKKGELVAQRIMAAQRETLEVRMEILAERATFAILRKELAVEATLKPNFAFQFQEPRANTPEEHASYVEPWVRHIRDVFAQGNEEQADYIWKWCAAPLQQPGARNHTCLIVRGKQGLGKSLWFSVMLKKLYGDTFVSITNLAHMLDR